MRVWVTLLQVNKKDQQCIIFWIAVRETSLIAIQNIKQRLFGLLNRHCYIGILEYMYLNN